MDRVFRIQRRACPGPKADLPRSTGSTQRSGKCTRDSGSLGPVVPEGVLGPPSGLGPWVGFGGSPKLVNRINQPQASYAV